MAKVITFYSYKGGTGRSMALANIAWILATNQRRVLVIDWDLEAPGLHRYFRPFLSDPDLTQIDSRGIIDFVYEYAKQAATPLKEGESDRAWYRPYTDLSRWTIPLHWPSGVPVEFAHRGRIDFIPAGWQGPGYSERVTSFDWRHFYERLSGGAFLTAAKESLQEPYDYVLIDSRTGVSDTSGICTIHLPDALVVCFTLNNQSIAGAATVASAVAEWRPEIPIFPVPMRVDTAEKDKLNRRRRFCRGQFGELVRRLPGVDERVYWSKIEVPYFAYYAYEEILAPFEEEAGSIGSVLPSMEKLTEYVTNGQVTELVPVDDEMRSLVASEFARIPETAESQTSVMSPVRWAVARVALALWLVLLGGIAWIATRLTWSSSASASLLQIAQKSTDPLEAALILMEAQGMSEPSDGREFALKLAKEGLPSVVITGPYSSSDFSPDGTKIITSDPTSKPTTLWDAANGRQLKSFGSGIKGWRLSPDGRSLIVFEGLSIVGGPAIVDVGSEKLIWTWPDPYRRVTDVRFSRDGQRFSVLDDKRTIDTFRLGEKKPFLKFEISRVDAAMKSEALVYLSDDAELALGLKPPAVHVWRILDESTIRQVNVPDPDPRRGVSFDLSFERMLAFDQKGGVKIWDLDTGKTLKDFSTSLGSPLPVALSPDGKISAVYDTNSSLLRLHHGADYSAVREISSPAPAVLRFAPDSARFIVAGGTTVRVWTVQPPHVPDDRSWQDLLKDLRDQTTACLSAAQRQDVLGEPIVEAERKFEQCETHQGRPKQTSGSAGGPF